MVTTAAIPLRPAAPAASAGRAVVHSLESARRRRLRSSGSPETIRVLVVGSHALTRAGLRRLLEDAGLDVVGEAVDGREGARLARSTRPHVVLLDAGSLEPHPAVTTRALGGRAPVLLLAELDGDEHLLAALRAGATGVLPQDSGPAELASAVRTLAGGGALLPPRAVRRLIRELARTTSTTPR